MGKNKRKVNMEEAKVPEIVINPPETNEQDSKDAKKATAENQTMHKKERIMLDPHTAVAVGTIGKLSIKGNTIVLATAHPAKFSDMVVKELNIRPELPEKLKNILNKKESYKRLSSDLKEIKKYIIEKV